MLSLEKLQEHFVTMARFVIHGTVQSPEGRTWTRLAQVNPKQKHCKKIYSVIRKERLWMMIAINYYLFTAV